MFLNYSTCFERHTAHHQELKTVIAASGFTYVCGCRHSYDFFFRFVPFGRNRILYNATFDFFRNQGLISEIGTKEQQMSWLATPRETLFLYSVVFVYGAVNRNCVGRVEELFRNILYIHGSSLRAMVIAAVPKFSVFLTWLYHEKYLNGVVRHLITSSSSIFPLLLPCGSPSRDPVNSLSEWR